MCLGILMVIPLASGQNRVHKHEIGPNHFDLTPQGKHMCASHNAECVSHTASIPVQTPLRNPQFEYPVLIRACWRNFYGLPQCVSEKQTTHNVDAQLSLSSRLRSASWKAQEDLSFAKPQRSPDVDRIVWP